MAKNTTRRAHAVGRALNDSAAQTAAVPEGNSYGSEADFLARVLADPEVPVDFTDYLANVIIDIQGDVSLWTPEVLRVAWPLIRRQPGNGGAGLWIAIAEANVGDALKLWARVREAADDELESGRRGATVTGSNSEPYAQAQFLAIRDAFADQWQPQGGIESAMVDMLTVAFSLQMYWTTIAHQRATRTHDKQRKELQRYESNGWKSPYQSEADGIEQAHRLADGYNRQFLRVLRQLRDLRRYAPMVIQNNGGQVNVAADGGQQVNVK